MNKSFGIEETLKATVNSLSTPEKVWQGMAAVYWAEVVGTDAAAASEAEKVVNGVLHVSVVHSVWSQELILLKGKILPKLNAKLGGRFIKDIRFSIGNVAGRVGTILERDPTEQELESIILDEKELAILQEELNVTQSIPDEKLREAITRRVTRNRLIRRWRQDHGWKICLGCTALHQTDNELCPLCRIS